VGRAGNEARNMATPAPIATNRALPAKRMPISVPPERHRQAEP
jgi:hypothetical protein